MSLESFKERYLRESAFHTGRDGKQVCVTASVLKEIRSVAMLADNPKVTISGVIDNILREFLIAHSDDIRKLKQEGFDNSDAYIIEP